jgi:hypothetical protein
VAQHSLAPISHVTCGGQLAIIVAQSVMSCTARLLFRRLAPVITSNYLMSAFGSRTVEPPHFGRRPNRDKRASWRARQIKPPSTFLILVELLFANINLETGLLTPSEIHQEHRWMLQTIFNILNLAHPYLPRVLTLFSGCCMKFLDIS